MRAWKNPSFDDLRERYLGEIAPLLDAARVVDYLSPAQKKLVRKRIVRTLFRTRLLSFRVRLVPVLAALGMLVIGGAAFAAAEHLGIIPMLRLMRPSLPGTQPKPEMRKRKGGGAKSVSHMGASPEVSVSESVPASPEETSLVLPDVPSPLLFPIAQASTSGWALLPEVRNPPALELIKTASSVRGMTPTSLSARPRRRLALATLTTATSAQADPRKMPASPPTDSERAQHADSTVASGPLPTPAYDSVAQPAPVLAQPVDALPLRPLPSDQALFAQAMRKLRMENNPSAAFSALQEHARAYPRSSLSGERSALEVEALLALHRDPEALVRLDAMALEDLPRSGERLVVRGELRAAARRWPEASADFDLALTRVSGSPTWNERALWGRGVARLHCGEREAGMADIESYHDRYPKGRFAAEAAKFFMKR
jgi:hypothetical protein